MATATKCHFCRLGERDAATGECSHCGRPLGEKTPARASGAAGDAVAVEGDPCPTCGRKVPMSGKTRAANARDRAKERDASESEDPTNSPSEASDE